MAIQMFLTNKQENKQSLSVKNINLALNQSDSNFIHICLILADFEDFFLCFSPKWVAVPTYLPDT